MGTTSRSNSLREALSEAGEAREACWFISSNSRFLLVYLFLGDETRCFLVAQKIEPLGVERLPMRQIKHKMFGNVSQVYGVHRAVLKPVLINSA